MIVPTKLRHECIEKIQSSHFGVEGCLRRARDCIFWPGMTSQLEQWIATCNVCRQLETTPTDEPLQSHEIPNRPWAKVGVDLFQVENTQYMVTVDYYSNFWEVDKLDKTDAQVVIRKLKAHFARYGIPDILISDNGPQFVSQQFRKFASLWEFTHIKTSPYHSRSNGKAESAVKTAKRMIRKAILSNQDIYLSLLDHRNTPSQGFSSSPAQRLMSRRTKTRLPILESKLKPKVVKVDQEMKASQQKQATYFNKTAKQRPGFKQGDVVRMKPVQGKKWKKGMIESKVGARSYQVKTTDGRTFIRNSKYLKKSRETFESQNQGGLDAFPLDLTPLIEEMDTREKEKEPQMNNLPPVDNEPPINGNGNYTTRSGRLVKRPKRFIEEF